MAWAGTVCKLLFEFVREGADICGVRAQQGSAKKKNTSSESEEEVEEEDIEEVEESQEDEEDGDDVLLFEGQVVAGSWDDVEILRVSDGQCNVRENPKFTRPWIPCSVFCFRRQT